MPYRVDLHVHTRRHSECAPLLEPHAVGVAAMTRGLHGVVLAEHDALWDAAELAELAARVRPLRVYRAAEVTTDAGHLIVVGIDQLPPDLKGCDPRRVMDLAREAGAAVLLPHPHRLTDLPRLLAPVTVRRGIDAVEVASSVTRGEASRRAMDLSRDLGAAAVGGSDAHAPELVGAAFTWFPELPADERALATAIRTRRVRTARAGEP